jgi:hypothetical protein
MVTPAKKAKSSARRVASYRDRMRAKGLVPKTIWVPNFRDPAVLAEYRRQARAIAAHTGSEQDALDFIEQVFEWPPDDTIPEFAEPEEN